MTKPVTVTIPHELGRAEARKRIEDGIGRLGHQFEGVKLNKATVAIAATPASKSIRSPAWSRFAFRTKARQLLGPARL